MCRCSAERSNIYFLGELGEDCDGVCWNNRMLCTGQMDTNNNIDLFTQLGVSCTPNTQPWSHSDEPCFNDDPRSDKYGECLGFVGVPDSISCSGSYYSSRRLCQCKPSDGCQGPDSDRVECFPGETGISQDRCLLADCCYDPTLTPSGVHCFKRNLTEVCPIGAYPSRL